MQVFTEFRPNQKVAVVDKKYGSLHEGIIKGNADSKKGIAQWIVQFVDVTSGQFDCKVVPTTRIIVLEL